MSGRPLERHGIWKRVPNYPVDLKWAAFCATVDERIEAIRRETLEDALAATQCPTCGCTEHQAWRRRLATEAAL